MSLVDTDDVQIHLPLDKFQVEEVPDSITQVELDVERVIKGYLSGTFAPATLAGWSTPGATPGYIRAIGGRLAAALMYRLRLAEDSPTDSDYAQVKYNEAMAMLELVRLGQVTLPEVEEEVDTGAHLSTGHYLVGTDPKFTMDSEF